MSYVCAVTSLGRRGGEAAFSPLLLTLEVTPKKETFITLTCGCCGGERRRCVGVLVCVCVCFGGERARTVTVLMHHAFAPVVTKPKLQTCRVITILSCQARCQSNMFFTTSLFHKCE